MATAIDIQVAPPDTQRISLRGISWQTYQRIAEELGDRRAVLLAYKGGILELTMPGPLHEDFKARLRRLVETVTDELAIPCKGLGSTRWDRPAAFRGLESDECYFLTAPKVEAARHRSADAADYPTPDLAIEVDLRRSEVNRPEIYATLGVPEVWRFDGETLRIDRLRDDGTYEASATSQFLPIRPEEVAHWVLDVPADDDNAWVRLLRPWIQAVLAPRRQD